MIREKTRTNLDFLCMKTAQEMVAGEGEAGVKENMSTKALGVLLENGPYGLILYLETQGAKQRQLAKHYQNRLLLLCADKLVSAYINSSTAVPTDGDFDRITAWLRNIARDLDQYLFVKQLWQQSLTYARYHAKASESSTLTSPAHL